MLPFMHIPTRMWKNGAIDVWRRAVSIKTTENTDFSHLVGTQISSLGSKNSSVEFIKHISPWHDVPLQYHKDSNVAQLSHRNKNIFYCVNEIPRGSMSKFEIQTKTAFNPIMQDIHKSNGALRYLLYSKDGIPFNYGCIPRTWEGNTEDHKYEFTSEAMKGDDDPIDVVDISRLEVKVGDITKIIVLGSMGLVDQGEIDWKIFSYALNDQELNIVMQGDSESYQSFLLKVYNRLNEIRPKIEDWFVNYKTVDGKSQNTFVNQGSMFDIDFSHHVILDANKRYNSLINGSTSNSSCLWIPIV